MQTTSLTLLQRLAQQPGDDDWNRLLSIYRPLIYSQVCQFPTLISEADDITQNVILVLMREVSVFQRQRTGSFRAWLRGIVVNQLRNTLRKNKRSPIINSGTGELENILDEWSDPASIASKKWDDEHDRMVFLRASEIVKNEVEPQTWAAFVGHALEGRSVAQVSAELGISCNSVLLAKSRLTKRIRNEVSGLLSD
jgi:RNA polymerase sigma-70 factor, ECF subfamily